VNKVILNWQRSLWERDQEVVKRSGRDEPMWVAIHKCMEAMLGIALYSYLLILSLQQNQRTRGLKQVLPGKAGGGGRGWPK
jgi:hypothetical protein